MKYLVLVFLGLIGCDKPRWKRAGGEVAFSEKGGTAVCGGQALKFQGPVDISGNWVTFTTEDGSVIKTSFPCALIWDKE